MSCKRVAVVTGSNKGIGLAIVRGLCKEFDGDVFLTSRNEGRGQVAVKQLESEGLKPKFHLLDITDRNSITCLKEDIAKQYGGVDVFVHNAAIAYKAADTTPFAEQAKVTIASNFTSTINLCHAFLPLMRADGRFVTVSSTVGVWALQKCSTEVQAFFKSPDLSEDQLVARIDEFVESVQTGKFEGQGFPNSAYGMSKLGVNAFTRIMGKKFQQLEKPNVLINCACPGFVKTDMSSQKGPKTPDEGAETPLFLALLPEGSKEPNGEFLSEKKIESWYK